MTAISHRAKTLIIALLVGVIALGAGIAVAHSDGTEIRITAMRLDDGRIEFAVQEREGEGWGERVLPRQRFFPTTSEGRWLNSTPITVGVVDELEPATPTPAPAATAAATPTDTSTPTVNFGAWTQVNGASVRGDYVGYGLRASSHSGYSWEDAPALLVTCGVGNATSDQLWIATPYLLHGGNDTATVRYRFATEASPTTETWTSNEELDSLVWPQVVTFRTRLAQATGLLYVEFVSLYDSKSHTATFDVTGATSVADELTCF